MRIWDVAPDRLCRKHLLGEHRELHALWTILTQGRKGYSHHPETLRWRGKLKALFRRHQALAKEMERRGYKHRSLLDRRLASGASAQTETLEPVEMQMERLRNKKCGCLLPKKDDSE
ncbi:MAG: pyrimidine dimer DNA glycosylase [Candidatus Aminicenantes bacterium]|nr:pyrimidine dimer DNA glycosylase [Candidatus Aminicenantes bacterium]